MVTNNTNNVSTKHINIYIYICVGGQFFFFARTVFFIATQKFFYKSVLKRGLYLSENFFIKVSQSAVYIYEKILFIKVSQRTAYVCEKIFFYKSALKSSLYLWENVFYKTVLKNSHWLYKFFLVPIDVMHVYLF